MFSKSDPKFVKYLTPFCNVSHKDADIEAKVTVAFHLDSVSHDTIP